MFLNVWRKECSQIVKNLTYWLYVICLVVFFTSQLGSMKEHMISEPKPNEKTYIDYGTKVSHEEKDIMRAALGKVVKGYYEEHYVTYPVGFAKNITLGEEDKKEIAGIIKRTTGINENEIEQKMEDFYKTQDMQVDVAEYLADPKEDLSYDEFLAEMKKMTKILGAGSDFTEEKMKADAVIPMDYEGAKEEYDNLVQKDGYTGGYLRLFCDYMGIIVAILPVFVVATRSLRDKRAKMKDLVYTRKVSSATVIGSRYMASVSMMMLPIIILSFVPMFDCMMIAKGRGIEIDYLAFLKYDFGWILPTVMAVSAIGMFLTELTESALAVLVQGVIWYGAIQLGANTMDGGKYGWNLVPRHNTELNYIGFHEGFRQLIYNRLLYVGVALVLVAVTIFVYEKKRKGHLSRNGKIRNNHKRTVKA